MGDQPPKICCNDALYREDGCNIFLGCVGWYGGPKRSVDVLDVLDVLGVLGVLGVLDDHTLEAVSLPWCLLASNPFAREVSGVLSSNVCMFCRVWPTFVLTHL